MSLPHTQTTRAYDWCAYTAKVRRLGAMLRAYDHDVILYAGTDNDADVTEFVTVVGGHDRHAWFGGDGWDIEQVFDRWDATDRCWKDMNARAIAEIERRIAPGDAVGIIAGQCQAAIAEHFSRAGYLILEWGVGYEGVLPYAHRCFESHAWRHFVYGKYGTVDGRFFDAVIPNAFDPAEFTPRDDSDGYLLYLGRPTERKGLAVVRELAQHFSVVTAGQGPAWCDGAHHFGVVLGDEKAKLLAGAKAVVVPTFYIEPFGGVAVEAMMSGAPVLTTDFGAFTETVVDGVTGFRCNTLAEFIAGAGRADELSRRAIARHAVQNYSTQAVAPRYDRWLRRCEMLYGDGWYAGVDHATEALQMATD